MEDEKLTLGGQIRNARLAKGMTQADLASRVGRSRVAVSEWERGVKAPRVRVIPRLVDALGIPVDILVKANRASKKNISIEVAA
jgi:transcriptional regulator with XRE-family HTH domain